MGGEIKKRLFLLLLVLLALYRQQKLFAVEETPLGKYILYCTDSYKNYHYYTSLPEVVIQNRDDRVYTEYRLANGNGGYVEGRLKNQEKISLHEEFKGEKNVLTVWMEDREGERYEEQVLKIRLDQEPPRTQILGADHRMASAGKVELTFLAEDNCELDTWEVSILWKDVEGNESYLSAEDWKETGGRKSQVKTLEQEGVYRIEMYAVDRAGQESRADTQVIIDRMAPVIMKIKDLNGKYMRQFCLSSPVGQYMKDATSCTCEMQLDDKLYRCGEKVTEEGMHRLRITAEDLAGNQTEENVEFIIDRTPPEILVSGIEEGAAYKESAVVQVKLRNPADKLEQVLINGEEMQADGGRNVWEYQISEPGEWEIFVLAEDKAGNRAEKSILFRVTEEDEGYSGQGRKLLLAVGAAAASIFMGAGMVKIRKKEFRE